MSSNIHEPSPVLMSQNSINGLATAVSSPRGAMLGGNLGQYLVIPGATPRRLRADTEFLFAGTTFAHKFETDVEIFSVIHRFPRTNSRDSIASNPQTVVIYQEAGTPHFGVMDLYRYHITHQAFGFQYKETDLYNRLGPGQVFYKGDVIAKSPNVTEDGDFMPGLEANAAFLSDAAVIEDGAKVSRSYLERITPTRLETRSISFGSTHFPINFYGDQSRYLGFPDVGSRVASCGLLCSLREFDDIAGVVNMSPEALLSPDYTHDRRIYASKDALVVDIRVDRNDRIALGTQTPIGVEAQLLKYYNAEMVFHRKILDAYNELQKRWGKSLSISGPFQIMVVDALAHLHSNKDYNDFPGAQMYRDCVMEKLHHNSKMDEWRVEVTFQTTTTANTGLKVTGMYGNKMIICSVEDDENMPVDDFGNRVDIVMDADSVTKRENPAVFMEQYINASARDTTLRTMEIIGYDLPNDATASQVRDWFHDPRHLDKILIGFEYVKGFYKIQSPMAYDAIVATIEPDRQEILNFMRSLAVDPTKPIPSDFRGGIYPHYPTDSPVFNPDMFRELRKNYRPNISPVTMRGLNGEMVRTRADVLIGSMYFLVLEKTGEDWSAVASPKLGHYGTPARLTAFDKHSEPVRFQPTKSIGESEARSKAAAVGTYHLADLMDACNNPQAIKYMQRKVLEAEHPVDIARVIDRDEIPMGGHRPLGLVNHIFECYGRKLVKGGPQDAFV